MGLCLPAGSHTAIEMSRQRAQKAPSSASRPAAERRLGRLGAALALAKLGAEYILRWLPPGTHDWNKFLKPEELQGFMAGQPFRMEGPFGVAYSPLSGRWDRSADTDINYMMTVTRTR